MEIAENTTLEKFLNELDKNYNGKISKYLFDENGNLKFGVRVFLNGRDIRFLNTGETYIGHSDVLLFLPLMAGG